MLIHNCNLKCEPPLHCEVLYSDPKIKSSIPVIGLKILMDTPLEGPITKIEPAPEAKPAPDGYPTWTQKALVWWVEERDNGRSAEHEESVTPCSTEHNNDNADDGHI